MLRFFTAGESHGPALVAIVEGAPAGVAIPEELINRDLKRRQGGYGRGGRQRIESDQVRFLSGMHKGLTIGSPLALLVTNRDFENWKERDVPPWTRPRPGHADLAGGHKYGLDDLRLVAERASARVTAARVAAGGVAKAILALGAITVESYVESLGPVVAELDEIPLQERIERALESDVSCPDASAGQRMKAAIDQAKENGESLGGVFVVIARRLPVGLGSHVHWDRRLDGRLAQALMSIQAIKGVEIGPAFENSRLPGTKVHDALYASASGPARRANRAGGLEGGITNGEPIIIRAAMKPIPTTIKPVETIDLVDGQPTTTQYQRSDVCALPAAAVVGEAMVALCLADALLERYGGDSAQMIAERIEHER